MTNNFQEFVWTEINLHGTDELLLGCMYRSPNSESENVCYMSDEIRHVCSLNHSHILTVGDFNFRNIDWDLQSSTTNEHCLENKFVEVVKDMFLFQHVKVPTRFRPGCFELLCIKNSILNETLRFNHKKANFNQIKSDINRMRWHELDNVGSQMPWEIFSEYLFKLVEKKCARHPRHKNPYIEKETEMHYERTGRTG